MVHSNDRGKPNNTPMYTNIKTDPPLIIIKHIHKSKALRLITNSSNANTFDKANMEYEIALTLTEYLINGLISKTVTKKNPKGFTRSHSTAKLFEKISSS